MVKIKYDTTEVDRSKDGDFVPPRPGVYPMRIESALFEKKDSSHPDRVVFVVRQEGTDPEGNGQGYGFWKYVNLDEASAWVMDQFLRAVGIDTEAKPSGEIDTKFFEGKPVLGRVKSDYYGEEYKPKLGRVMPLRGAEDEEDYDTGSSVDTGGGEEETSLDLDIVSYTEEEIDAFGAGADEGEEDSQNFLTLCGENAGLDPNEYPTWAELATAINELRVPEEKPAPAKKAAAKKAAAAKLKDAPAQAAADEGGGEDYESWELKDINAELTARSLATTGPMSAKIARLRANDNDPFSEG
jgi:hypothetical protein